MPTRTGSSSSRDRLREGEQPSYQPGGEYQPWDHDSGSLRLANDSDSRDAAFSDNGRGYYDDHLDNGHSSTRGREQIGEGKGGASNSLSNLRNAENDAASGREKRYYTGNGGKNNQKAKAKSNKRKAAVIGVIASIIIGGGAFLGSSNSLLAPAMSNLLTSATNTQGISNSLRAKFIAKFLSAGTSKSATWPTNGFSESFLKRLGNNKITSTKIGNVTTLHFEGIDITNQNFDKIYKDNPAFRDAYDSSRRSKIASFFDPPANKTLSKRGVSRNMWKDYRQTGDSEVDEDAFNKTMIDKFDDISSNSLTAHSETKETEEVWDEDEGKYVTKDKYVDHDGDASGKPASEETFEGAQTKAKGSIAAIADTVTDVLDLGCGVYRIGNLISMVVAAHSIYQSIHYFQSFMESISKMMAGEGDASAINATLNKMNYVETAEIPDGNGGTTQITGSMLESPGLQLVLGGAYGTLGAKAISQIGKTYSNERAGLSLFNNGYAMNACSAEQLTSSAISLAVNLTGGVASIVGGFLIKTVGAVLISSVASAIIGFMLPTVASLFLNTFVASVGIPGGHTLMGGASAAGATLAQSANGSSAGSKATSNAFNHARSEVLALEAEVDRMKLSPFNASNPNTFLGSIAYSLLPTITSTKFTSVTSLVRSASTSFASLTKKLIGTASADGEGTSYLTTYGDCPALDSIGAAGDIYCNPVTSTDLSTVDISPDDPTYQNYINNSTTYDDSTDSYKINKGSELAKYITYCDGRTSPLGIPDAGILNDLQTGSEVSILGSVPIVGDVLGIINAAEDMANMNWATGANCVNSTENDRWEEMKYYQRYVEDQRILDQMGAYEGSQNPVAVYEEEYEKEHPLDNSQAGIIARYTGMSKTDAEYTIAFIEYAMFLNEYDASTRIALKGNTTTSKTSAEIITAWSQGKYKEIQKNIVNDPIESKTIAKQHVIYFDIRNRSYAA